MYNAYIVRAGVGLFFNGRLLSNNSMVFLGNIGEGSSALYCLTDRELCCSVEAGTRPRGLWFSPSGDVISDTNSDVYTSKGFSSIHLNRRSTAMIPAGVYRCLLPDSGNVLRTISVTVVANSK